MLRLILMLMTCKGVLFTQEGHMRGGEMLLLQRTMQPAQRS